MIAVVQRSLEASVTIEGDVRSSIPFGLVVLVGIEEADEDEDVDWLCRKIANLRIFDDEDGVMNRSALDVGASVLVVSQFTLHASVKKGNRPSYIVAAKPDTAIPLYERFITRMRETGIQDVAAGEFGADMKISLINDGPVTILIDTKNKK